MFWLDETRAHDARAAARRSAPRSSELDTDGLQIEILDVAEAARFTLERARDGEDTISVTGNVLRDYLTDLFPILELGTSAKMLSIVPLMERRRAVRDRRRRLGAQARPAVPARRTTCAGTRSASSWRSAPSLELLADKTDNPRAQLLADTLDRATGRVLEENRSPSRKVGELDNRGSHFYLALYWAQELAEQTEDAELAAAVRAAGRAARRQTRQTIVAELDAVQGSPVDIGGYYRPDPDTVTAAMRPSATLNAALAAVLETEIVAVDPGDAADLEHDQHDLAARRTSGDGARGAHVDPQLGDHRDPAAVPAGAATRWSSRRPK